MWEKIKDDTGRFFSSRLKVPGGWIVRTVVISGSGSSLVQTFVADSSHSWRLPEVARAPKIKIETKNLIIGKPVKRLN